MVQKRKITYIRRSVLPGRTKRRTIGTCCQYNPAAPFFLKGNNSDPTGTLTPRLEIDWNLINPPSTLQNGRSTDTMVAGGIGRGNTLIIECPVDDDDAAAAGVAPRNSKLIRTDLCAQVRLILDGRRRDHGGSAAAAAAAAASVIG